MPDVRTFKAGDSGAPDLFPGGSHHFGGLSRSADFDGGLGWIVDVLTAAIADATDGYKVEVVEDAARYEIRVIGHSGTIRLLYNFHETRPEKKVKGKKKSAKA